MPHSDDVDTSWYLENAAFFGTATMVGLMTWGVGPALGLVYAFGSAALAKEAIRETNDRSLRRTTGGDPTQVPAPVGAAFFAHVVAQVPANPVPAAGLPRLGS